MHERILKSALEVFSEKGYSAATIRDISSRAGCNTVTVFRHFEDKLGTFSAGGGAVQKLCVRQRGSEPETQLSESP